MMTNPCLDIPGPLLPYPTWQIGHRRTAKEEAEIVCNGYVYRLPGIGEQHGFLVLGFPKDSFVATSFVEEWWRDTQAALKEITQREPPQANLRDAILPILRRQPAGYKRDLVLSRPMLQLTVQGAWPAHVLHPEKGVWEDQATVGVSCYLDTVRMADGNIFWRPSVPLPVKKLPERPAGS